MLCELYSRNKKEMSRADKQEALDYFRGRYWTLWHRRSQRLISYTNHTLHLPPSPLPPPRVVVFIDQIRELLDLVLSKWNTLTDDQKAEVAQHIIPEVGERERGREGGREGGGVGGGGGGRGGEE